MVKTAAWIAAALLALALSACESSTSSVDPDFACPSHNCVGVTSSRSLGGNDAN